MIDVKTGEVRDDRTGKTLDHGWKVCQGDDGVHVVPFTDATGKTDHDIDSLCWCDPKMIEDHTASGGQQLWMHRGDT